MSQAKQLDENKNMKFFEKNFTQKMGQNGFTCHRCMSKNSNFLNARFFYFQEKFSILLIHEVVHLQTLLGTHLLNA